MSIPTDLMIWLEALPMKHWEDRADWFRIACIMKFEGGTIQEFVRLSRRVKRYEQEPMYRYQKVLGQYQRTQNNTCYSMLLGQTTR